MSSFILGCTLVSFTYKYSKTLHKKGRSPSTISEISFKKSVVSTPPDLFPFAEEILNGKTNILYKSRTIIYAVIY